MKGMEHRGITSVDGPVIIVKRSENSFYGEIVYSCLWKHIYIYTSVYA
mgnify:CR=1 FL=1